ncbi:MAG: Asp-tRNA(Asn)/Glu-tRNA(Gln) amidotransferase GatCAB subunit B, partial [Nitrosarchaeum sp.]
GNIARNSAKNALYEIIKTGKQLSDIISEFDLGNVSDESELLKIVESVISEEPQAVEQAKSNTQTINYLVGKVMQKTKGKADPKLTLDLLKKKIE